MASLAKLLAFFGLGFLFTFAYLTAIRAAFVLAYVMALLFFGAWVWVRVAGRQLKLTSQLEAAVPAVGEPFQEHFRLSHEAFLPVPLVEVADASDLPGYRPSRVVALGGDAAQWSERGIFSRRGWATFGPTNIRLGDPFGLFRRELKLKARSRILVYPRVVPIHDLITSAQQQAGDAPRLGAWADQPPEAGGVREYTLSDSYGRIHWPLSVKHGRLVSKTFELPLTADLWVVLDLDHHVHARSGEEATVEYAVSLAASVAMHVLGRARSVGLIANDGAGTIIEPARAARRDRGLLDYLALAQADGSIPLAKLFLRERVRRLPRRSLAVVTPSPDPEWMTSLRAFAGKRTALLVFYLDATSFGAPGPAATFDFGPGLDLFVIRRGDDLSRLTRTRDAVRVG